MSTLAHECLVCNAKLEFKVVIYVFVAATADKVQNPFQTRVALHIKLNCFFGSYLNVAQSEIK